MSRKALFNMTIQNDILSSDNKFLKSENIKLKYDNQHLKREKNFNDLPMPWKKIKTDDKMNFYTGIISVKAFHAIFDLLRPFLQEVHIGGDQHVLKSKL